ncbi:MULTISPECIES: hypothetical protein [unclassified Microcoleus]|uniref:hypothetical protein n=1 Tax=unclassified Microcoleus TaxID=2642155 RepID=UPI002FD2CF58
MDAIINAVDLTALMPGYRPIAQLYTDYRSAIDRFVREKDRQPAAKILHLPRCGGGFPGRGAAQIPKSCISDR